MQYSGIKDNAIKHFLNFPNIVLLYPKKVFFCSAVDYIQYNK